MNRAIKLQPIKSASFQENEINTQKLLFVLHIFVWLIYAKKHAAIVIYLAKKQ